MCGEKLVRARSSMSPPRRIAPSRLTGLRGSVPRWFISCRNAGPTFCVLPSFLRPLLLRFSRRPTSFLSSFAPSPVYPPPGVVYSNGGGYFTQSTVAQDFHQIPVLDALPSSPSQISYPRASAACASIPHEFEFLSISLIFDSKGKNN